MSVGYREKQSLFTGLEQRGSETSGEEIVANVCVLSSLNVGCLNGQSPQGIRCKCADIVRCPGAWRILCSSYLLFMTPCLPRAAHPAPSWFSLRMMQLLTNRLGAGEVKTDSLQFSLLHVASHVSQCHLTSGTFGFLSLQDPFL